MKLSTTLYSHEQFAALAAAQTVLTETAMREYDLTRNEVSVTIDCDDFGKEFHNGLVIKVEDPASGETLVALEALRFFHTGRMLGLALFTGATNIPGLRAQIDGAVFDARKMHGGA